MAGNIAEKIVVLTGAGISQESGLDTFRDANGIWAKYSMDEVCTPEGFRRNPQKLHEFYNKLRHDLPNVSPNAAHQALAQLEYQFHEWNKDADFLIITQNIDDLHERAGSRNVIHMHGELYKLWCTSCNHRFQWQGACSVAMECPCCHQKSLRPDIVWFGEIPYEMERIDQALQTCTQFISIGTSGAVYPAAGFVSQVRGKARTVELNLEPSAGSCLFDETYIGKASELVPQFVNHFMETHGGHD